MSTPQKLEIELERAITWKLSERFKIKEGVYESFPPRPALDESYKSRNMFIVLWKGRNSLTGDRRKSYETWENVQKLINWK